MNTKPNLKKMRPILFGISIVGIAVLIFSISFHKRTNDFVEKYNPERQDLVETLILTGRLLPRNSLELKFNEAGEIENIYREEGQTIQKGQLFAELSHKLLDAELNETNAQIATRQASLEILLSGSRDEDISEQIAATELAELQRDHAITNLESTARDAKNQADNAIRNAVDDFFVNPRSSNPQLSFALSKNQSLQLDLEFRRRGIEKLLDEWQLDFASAMTLENYKERTEQVLSRLDIVREFLRIAALAVNGAEPTSDLTDTTIRAWKTNLASQRTVIDGAIQAIQSGQQSISEKTLTLARANSVLSRLQNGSTPQELSAKEAEIQEVVARKNTIFTKIQNRKIYAPISGIIAEVKKSKGENVTTQDVIGVLISENNFEVELEVPELNITAIEKDDVVQISFAALPGKVFRGKINEIAETAETGANLVPYYKVTVLLEDPDPTLRSGLIADVIVTTNTYENVLAVPARFIQTNKDGEYLSILGNDEKITTQKITTGPKSGGMVIIESPIETGITIVIEK